MSYDFKTETGSHNKKLPNKKQQQQQQQSSGPPPLRLPSLTGGGGNASKGAKNLLDKQNRPPTRTGDRDTSQWPLTTTNTNPPAQTAKRKPVRYTYSTKQQPRKRPNLENIADDSPFSFIHDNSSNDYEEGTGISAELKEVCNQIFDRQLDGGNNEQVEKLLSLDRIPRKSLSAPPPLHGILKNPTKVEELQQQQQQQQQHQQQQHPRQQQQQQYHHQQSRQQQNSNNYATSRPDVAATSKHEKNRGPVGHALNTFIQSSSKILAKKRQPFLSSPSSPQSGNLRTSTTTMSAAGASSRNHNNQYSSKQQQQQQQPNTVATSVQPRKQPSPPPTSPNTSIVILCDDSDNDDADKVSIRTQASQDISPLCWIGSSSEKPTPAAHKRNSSASSENSSPARRTRSSSRSMNATPAYSTNSTSTVSSTQINSLTRELSKKSPPTPVDVLDQTMAASSDVEMSTDIPSRLPTKNASSAFAIQKSKIFPVNPPLNGMKIKSTTLFPSNRKEQQQSSVPSNEAMDDDDDDDNPKELLRDGSGRDIPGTSTIFTLDSSDTETEGNSGFDDKGTTSSSPRHRPNVRDHLKQQDHRQQMQADTTSVAAVNTDRKKKTKIKECDHYEIMDESPPSAKAPPLPPPEVDEKKSRKRLMDENRKSPSSYTLDEQGDYKAKVSFTKHNTRNNYSSSSVLSQSKRRTKTQLGEHRAAKGFAITPGASLSNVDADDDAPTVWEYSSSSVTKQKDVGENKHSKAILKKKRSPGVEPKSFYKQDSGKSTTFYGETNDELVDTDDDINHAMIRSKRSKDDEEYSSKQTAKSKSSIAPRRSPRKSNSRYSSSRRGPDVPIQINDSSDDETSQHLDASKSGEASMPQSSHSFFFEAARIAIGQKVFPSGCRIELESPSGRLKLFFRRNNAVKDAIWVDSECLTELKYYMSSFNNDTLQRDTAEDEICFLAMRVTPTEVTGLKTYSTSYCQDDALIVGKKALVDEKKKYIVVEFRSDNDFRKLLKLIRQTPLSHFATRDSQLPQDEAASYSRAFLDRDEKDKRQRRGSPRKKHHEFIGNRKDNDILLVYPFPAKDSELREAVKDLTELRGFTTNESESTDPSDDEDSKIGDNKNKATNPTSSDEAENIGNNVAATSKPPENSRGRAHYVTICVEDYYRLESPEFFNDSLIDFWMQWMRRRERVSTVHMFTSHFYTTLSEEGVSGVVSWTAKRGIDIFEKKFIFIPVNKNLHWSLCVVVNPGAIVHYSESPFKTDKCPCIIFLDSLKAHQKTVVARKIRLWLNSEWKRLKEDTSITFTDKNMPVYDPRIPYQDNCWDCGVFVCRYAYAMYQLRHRDFNCGEVGKGSYQKLITESIEFQFDMKDIERIRDELRTLLERLSLLYAKWKADERQKKIEAKRAATMSAAASSESNEAQGNDPSLNGAISAPTENAPTNTFKSKANMPKIKTEDTNGAISAPAPVESAPLDASRPRVDIPIKVEEESVYI